MTRRKYSATRRRGRTGSWTSTVGSGDIADPEITPNQMFWQPVLSDEQWETNELSEQGALHVRTHGWISLHSLLEIPQDPPPVEIEPVDGLRVLKRFMFALVMATETIGQSGATWAAVQRDGSYLTLWDAGMYDGGFDVLGRWMWNSTMSASVATVGLTTQQVITMEQPTVMEFDVGVKRRLKQSESLYLVVDPETDAFYNRSFHIDLNVRTLFRSRNR